MAVAHGAGLPISVCVTSASPHEVTLVEENLDANFAPGRPQRFIGDPAYDSDGLDRGLAELSIEMIAPHGARRAEAAALQDALED